MVKTCTRASINCQESVACGQYCAAWSMFVLLSISCQNGVMFGQYLHTPVLGILSISCQGCPEGVDCG